MSGGLSNAGSVSQVPASNRSVPQSSPDVMNGKALQRKVIIANPMGFHFRPVAAFAKLASTYQSTVTVSKEEKRVNGKSPLELMLLAAEQGSELVVETSGPDAHEALDALTELLS